MASKTSQYSESSIRVLKGLEPVKQRPGMYTRTDNPLHIVQEVIDNASDEALGGHGSEIMVTLHRDGSVSVEDDGRGIPVGIHPEEKVPVVEIVFTRLHAGGKFDKGKGGAYAFSGGLHGVGVSVTNALSTRLDVAVWRDGSHATLTFSGGDVTVPLATRKLERGEKKNGTRVQVWPDAKYFDSATIPLAELQRLLRSKAVLLPGVKVTLLNEKNGERQTWQYDQGLKGYLVEALAQGSGAELVVPMFEGEHFADPDANPAEEGFAEGEGASWVVAWTEDGAPVRESYVNLIPTPAGGTHESGLREGLFQAVKSFIEMHALQPKGVKLMSEDVFARASFVLSAKVLDPQFQGQIKERLNSRDAVRLVSTFSRPALELWLNHHVEYGKKLAELVIRQAQARTRAAQKVEKKKGSGVAVLPGKLTDCESTDVTRNELYLGDRARPPVRQQRGARHRGGDRRGPARPRRRARPVQPALWQDLHPVRRGRGRRAHPGAAADAVLPPLPQADRQRQRVRGASAAVPRGRAGARQEAGAEALRARRRRAAGDPGQAAQGRRQGKHLADLPLQGPGRDERRAAVGNHHEPGHAPPAAGGAGQLRPAADRGRDEHADGQGRGGAAAHLARGARQRGGGRHLTRPVRDQQDARKADGEDKQT